MVNEPRWLGLIFALYFLLGFGYSLLMPLWEAPDEPAHYHLAWHLATYDEYPSEEVNYESHQPRAYYYFGSWIIQALNEVDPELTRFQRPKEYPFTIRKPERRFEWTDENYRFLWGAYILRWVNMSFGALALWIYWRTFKQIAPSSLALAALALVALMPQYLHITSSINNDTPATLAGALLFYLGIRVLKQPSRWLSGLLILLVVLLPFVTKLNVLPVSAALFLILAWKWFFGYPRKQWLLYATLFVVIGAGIIYFLFPETVRSAWNEIEWRLFSLRKDALTAEYLKDISSQIIWTYWGKVGWLAVGLPVQIIQILTSLGVIGMVLQIYFLFQSKARGLELSFWLAAWLIAVVTLLAVFRNGLTTYATQGRLLFPAVGALSILMLAGWHNIGSSRVQHYLPLFVLLLLVFGNLFLWLTGIVPIYYQPFLD